LKAESSKIKGKRWMKNKVTIVHREFGPIDVYEMANMLKSQGCDKYYAWDMYTKWTNLKPKVDAAEFYRIFKSAPGNWIEKCVEVSFKPTHFDRISKQYVQITVDERGVFMMIWEDGTTGSNPPTIPPEEDRYLLLVG
jgi:hypothetical protein